MRGSKRAGYGDARPAHYAVFRRLALEGSRATEPAEAAGMTRQSTGQLVARLERRGHVERRPDPRDGRVRIAAPTKAGIPQGTQAAAGRLEEIEAALAALSSGPAGGALPARGRGGYYGSNLSSRARAMASARLRTPSLR